MSALDNLIEYFRQTGSTTALVELAIQKKALLIVSNYSRKENIIKNYKGSEENKLLLELLIITFPDIKSGYYRRIFFNEERPTFFIDNECLCHLQFKPLNYKNEEINTSNIVNSVNSLNDKQINIKMNEDDIKSIADINQSFFENEASNSMLGRILLRKGIQFYKKLKESI